MTFAASGRFFDDGEEIWKKEYGPHGHVSGRALPISVDEYRWASSHRRQRRIKNYCPILRIGLLVWQAI